MTLVGRAAEVETAAAEAETAAAVAETAAAVAETDMLTTGVVSDAADIATSSATRSSASGDEFTTAGEGIEVSASVGSREATGVSASVPDTEATGVTSAVGSNEPTEATEAIDATGRKQAASAIVIDVSTKVSGDGLSVEMPATREVVVVLTRADALTGSAAGDVAASPNRLAAVTGKASAAEDSIDEEASSRRITRSASKIVEKAGPGARSRADLFRSDPQYNMKKRLVSRKPRAQSLPKVLGLEKQQVNRKRTLGASRHVYL